MLLTEGRIRDGMGKTDNVGLCCKEILNVSWLIHPKCVKCASQQYFKVLLEGYHCGTAVKFSYCLKEYNL